MKFMGPVPIAKVAIKVNETDSRNGPWYVESFKHDYLKIYAHRTDEAAQREVNLIIDLLNMQPGSKVLDLCCGHGRHSRALAQKGFKVTGLDLSAVLLEEARKRQKGLPPIRYVQGDVRQLPFEREFDYVLNLFTSFGYFDKRQENITVFDEIRKVLKPTGLFLIDFLNPGYVKRTLKPYTERQVDQLKIVERRKIEDGQVVKTIEVQEGRSKRYYEERVHLFSASEMKSFIQEAGLQVTGLYGSLAGETYDADLSERMILVGQPAD